MPTRLYTRLVRLASLMPTGGALAKYMVLLLFILNWRGWPLMWHLTIFKPVLIGPDLKRRWLNFTAHFKSKQRALEDDERFWTSNSPVGQDPFTFKTVYKSFTSFDDSDYNLHLSNSSYGKVFDGTRFKSAIAAFPQYLRIGGTIPLAATHYHFIREIPIFRNYQIHATFGGWDQKWLYVIGQFVMPKRPSSDSEPPKKSVSPPTNHLSAASLHTPVGPEDVYSSIQTPVTRGEMASIADTLQQATSILNQAPEGMTLHTVAISRLCFKVGRITVPPALVFAVNGLSGPSGNPAKPYSHENPPPHWQQVLELGHPRHGGSIKKMKDFLRGGWRDVPESERWWEQAFAGPVEEQRKANMRALEAIRSGMDYFGTK